MYVIDRYIASLFMYVKDQVRLRKFVKQQERRPNSPQAILSDEHTVSPVLIRKSVRGYHYTEGVSTYMQACLSPGVVWGESITADCSAHILLLVYRATLEIDNNKTAADSVE